MLLLPAVKTLASGLEDAGEWGGGDFERRFGRWSRRADILLQERERTRVRRSQLSLFPLFVLLSPPLAFRSNWGFNGQHDVPSSFDNRLVRLPSRAHHRPKQPRKKAGTECMYVTSRHVVEARVKDDPSPLTAVLPLFPCQVPPAPRRRCRLSVSTRRQSHLIMLFRRTLHATYLRPRVISKPFHSRSCRPCPFDQREKM